MVSKFNLIRTPKIVFGHGRSRELPVLLKNHGKRILVITGVTSYRQNQAIPEVSSLLQEHRYSLVFEKIDREPSPADIDKITGRYDQNEIDAVVAIGGGSVLDAGKAVSAMLPGGGNVRDYLEGVGTKSPDGIKKYFVAVPTTAGTGSEVTNNAVLSETGANGFKRSLRHENFVPDLAIIDPLLSLTCPVDITARSGTDAFTQLVESYLSVKANALTDALALEGIDKIHKSLVNAVKNGNDLESRSGMAYAATLSGITLTNAGLGLIHGFASAIGGYLNIPHGVVCGTLMGVVNKYQVESLLNQHETTIAHKKYAVLGKLLSGRYDKDDRWYMKYTADYIEEIIESLHLKRLGEFGLAENDLEKIALLTDHKANPVTFEKEALVKMLSERL